MKEPGWPFGNRPAPRKVWALWKSGRVMECEINGHPLGYELRIYMGGTFLTGQTFATGGLQGVAPKESARGFRPCRPRIGSGVTGASPSRHVHDRPAGARHAHIPRLASIRKIVAPTDLALCTPSAHRCSAFQASAFGLSLSTTANRPSGTLYSRTS